MKSRECKQEAQAMKVKANIIADTIIIAGIIAGCFALTAVPDKINTTNETEDEEVVIANLTTTTTEKVDSGFSIPSGDTSFKSYMDYRCITNTRSAQYKLQNDCWTDENGLRRCGDDYVIAVGTYYADYVGERVIVTLADDKQFTAVIGDFKADAHTDSTHRYSPMSNDRKNVIEFVVDTSALDKTARKMGDISYIEGFEGNVIEYDTIERVNI